MKKRLPKPGKIAWIIFATVIIITGGLLASKNWINTNYDRLKVERTMHSQINDLKEPLTALGFKDLGDLNTECGYVETGPHIQYEGATPTPGGKKSYACSTMINRTVSVPTDDDGQSAFRQHSVELSQAFDKHGWKQRQDLKTIEWFKKISEGIDWQPDQLNVKRVGDISCTVDFFTAFAKPAPPRISLQIICAKQDWDAF